MNGEEQLKESFWDCELIGFHWKNNVCGPIQWPHYYRQYGYTEQKDADFGPEESNSNSFLQWKKRLIKKKKEDIVF